MIRSSRRSDYLHAEFDTYPELNPKPKSYSAWWLIATHVLALALGAYLT
jgi:hypothetical protein